MHTHLLTGLLLCSALSRLGCGGSPSGNQPACLSGPAQPQAQWFLAGEAPKDYAISTDPQVTESGAPTETIQATVPSPSNFGTVMQTLPPTAFLNQRLSFSALVKTAGVTGTAGLWMRVDGPKDEGVLAFYNMSDQPLVGTEDWTPHTVTLDVDPDAVSVSFGLWLQGPGQIWLDEVALISCEPATDGGVTEETTPDASIDAGLGCGPAPVQANAP